MQSVCNRSSLQRLYPGWHELPGQYEENQRVSVKGPWILDIETFNIDERFYLRARKSRKQTTHTPRETTSEVHMPTVHDNSSVMSRAASQQPSTLIENRSIYERDDLEEERNGLEIAAAALGQPGSDGGVPFYTGNQHVTTATSSSAMLIPIIGEHTGFTSTLDVSSSGTTLPRHLLIPSRARGCLPEEDREYLRIKGVFTLPGNDACSELLRCYISHVHPVMPIIEINQVLDYYHAGRLQEYNILLLWSVFFAAVNVSCPVGFSGLIRD